MAKVYLRNYLKRSSGILIPLGIGKDISRITQQLNRIKKNKNKPLVVLVK